MKFKYWLIIVLMFLVIAFTIQNYTPVSLKFLFWSINTSQAILVFVTLFVGILIGVLIRKRS